MMMKTTTKYLCCAMYTNITEVNLSVFVYRLFREAFTPLFRTWSESFTKQSVDNIDNIYYNIDNR